MTWDLVEKTKGKFFEVLKNIPSVKTSKEKFHKKINNNNLRVEASEKNLRIKKISRGKHLFPFVVILILTTWGWCTWLSVNIVVITFLLVLWGEKCNFAFNNTEVKTLIKSVNLTITRYSLSGFTQQFYSAAQVYWRDSGMCIYAGIYRHSFTVQSDGRTAPQHNRAPPNKNGEQKTGAASKGNNETARDCGVKSVDSCAPCLSIISSHAFCWILVVAPAFWTDFISCNKQIYK